MLEGILTGGDQAGRLRDGAVRTLLVAGNRDSKAPGIGAWVETYLVEAFRSAERPAE